MRNSPNQRTLFLTYLAFVFGLAANAAAQETLPAPSDNEEQLKLWRGLYQELAEQYTFTAGEDNPSQLKLRSEPLHFYFNPAGGTQTHGSLLIWTDHERPAVIGALWSRKIDDERRVAASFHSATPLGVTGRRNGETFWHSRDGIRMLPVPQNAAPAAGPRRRLAQMRSMMRGLDAMRTDADRRSKLRVLPQPLYRYKNDNVIDGAVFGFFEDWDPEVFVLVEVSAKQPDLWQVGIVRFSNKRLSVGLDGKTIWEYDPNGAEPPLGGAEFLYVSKTVDVRSDRIDAPTAANDE